MQTPFFPAFRCRLAALGRRSVQSLRQTSLPQIQQLLGGLLPAGLLIRRRSAVQLDADEPRALVAF